MGVPDQQWIMDSMLRGEDFSSKVRRVHELVTQYAHTVDDSFTGTAIVGTDLDRTMVYTDSSMHVEEKLTDDLLFKVVEMYKRKPLSYITSPAYLNLEIINAHAHLVPVTTRTEQQFKRVKIPGTTHADFTSTKTQYAVVCNGAKILVNGSADKSWSKKVKEKYGKEASKFSDVEKYLKTLKHQPWVKNLMNAEDFFLYMSVDRSEMPDHMMNTLREKMATYSWNVSIQGRKVYFVPDFLDKGTAFAEIVTRLDADYSMTAGDSLLDISLLDKGDISFRPNHGELSDLNYVSNGVIVTNKHGIFAGEELTARFLAQIYAGM